MCIYIYIYIYICNLKNFECTDHNYNIVCHNVKYTVEMFKLVFKSGFEVLTLKQNNFQYRYLPVII